MFRRDWAGFTLPTPWGVWIFYWVPDTYTAPSARTRRHERTHARQIEQDGWFTFIRRYLWDWMRYGYKNIPYEVSATAAADQAKPDLKLVP